MVWSPEKERGGKKQTKRTKQKQATDEKIVTKSLKRGFGPASLSCSWFPQWEVSYQGLSKSSSLEEEFAGIIGSSSKDKCCCGGS